MAVFDVTTDTEIHTGQHGTLRGIPLPVRNPSDVAYEAVSGNILVQGSGRLENTWAGLPAEYSGGIAVIDPATYTARLLVDDGDDTHHPYGNITGMTISSHHRGYFIGYKGWGNNTLYAFNPANGDVEGPVQDELSQINISTINTDQNGRLWVGDATQGRIVVINPEDHSINDTISTHLNPLKIVFVNHSPQPLPAERVMNWLQWQYADVAPLQGMHTQDLDGWHLRHYRLTDIWLGAFDGQLYLYAPQVSDEVVDLGAVADWMPQAGPAGF